MDELNWTVTSGEEWADHETEADGSHGKYKEENED